MKQALIVLSIVFVIALIITLIGVVVGGKMLFRGSSDAGIIKSEDGGKSWVFLENAGGLNITVLQLDEDNPEKILAGTRREGLWTSEDGGDSWKRFAGAGEEKTIIGRGARVFDILQKKDSLIAAVFYDERGRVLELKDGSENELYFTPLSRYAVFGVGAHPFNSNILWIISSDGGFYETTDAGASWRAVSRLKEGILGMESHPRVPGRIWVKTSRGNLYGTYNAGRTWRDLSGGLSKFSGADEIEAVAYDENNLALYLGTSYGLLRSYDGGNSWKAVELTVPPEVLPITAVAVDPRNPDKILAAAKNQLYISQDGGFSWSGTILPTEDAVSAIEINPEDSNIIYIGLK